MLSVIMLSVIMPSVIVLSVLAPKKLEYFSGWGGGQTYPLSRAGLMQKLCLFGLELQNFFSTTISFPDSETEVLKFLKMVIYCHFTVIPSFCVIKHFYHGNYHGIAVNYYYPSLLFTKISNTDQAVRKKIRIKAYFSVLIFCRWQAFSLSLI
jgi:hypothetical protein